VTPSAAPAIEPPAPTRFAVEFGPFLSPTDAERTERQLGDAGHQTVRFRQQTGGGLYAVLIERVPGARDAETLVAALREQGFSDVIPVVSADQFTVRVGEPVALRGAVVLAERLRAQGYHVRVAAQPGEAVAFIIRHGNFGSREEAEERSGELARLGLPNHVVRVK
jgi:cell division protein FtsN